MTSVRRHFDITCLEVVKLQWILDFFLISQVELADRFMDLLGKVFQKKEWRMWEIDVDRIIIHHSYDEGSKNHH